MPKVFSTTTASVFTASAGGRHPGGFKWVRKSIKSAVISNLHHEWLCKALVSLSKASTLVI